MMMKLILFMFFMNFNIMIMKKNMLMIFLYNMLFILNIFMLINFNFNDSWMSIYNWMGLDKISLMLIFLSLWIISLMFFVSKKFLNKKFYSMMLMILLMSLFFSFSSMNYFMFYLFFEISIIPTFMLIMGWGYQPERIMSSMYMLMYTLLFSLPLMIIIYYLYNYFYSLNYLYLINEYMYMNMNLYLFYFFMIMAYMVKLPIFMFHMWLPKAHVEAPVTGSMILAGVMLKLGGYGIMRSMMMMMNLSIKFNYLFLMLNFMGFLYVSLICMRQFDMKMLVAYSSVVHMSIMVIGLLSMNYMGYFGGLILMIGHGLCSSGLFMMVNFMYERTKSRLILLNMGMNLILPNFMMWWFLFCGANMSMPITLNLMGELMIMMSLVNYINKYYLIILLLSMFFSSLYSLYLFALILLLSMFFSSLYSLYLFALIFHSKIIKLLKKIYSMNLMEFLSIIIHWIPLNFLIMKMNMFFY
nr:NADH dehydrogenase subunit 4 [Platyneura mayri]